MGIDLCGPVQKKHVEGPNLPESKRLNGTAAMVPDVGFTKQLKMLKSTFVVVWDQISSRWQIWDKDLAGIMYHVLTVETAGKTYKELSEDVLIKLKCNLISRIGWDETIAYFEEMDKQVQRRHEEELRTKFLDMAEGTYDYFRGMPLIQVPKEYDLKKKLIRVIT